MLSEASLDTVKSQSHLFTSCQLTNACLILKYPRHESELAPRVQFFPFYSVLEGCFYVPSGSASDAWPSTKMGNLGQESLRTAR